MDEKKIKKLHRSHTSRRLDMNVGEWHRQELGPKPHLKKVQMHVEEWHRQELGPKPHLKKVQMHVEEWHRLINMEVR